MIKEMKETEKKTSHRSWVQWKNWSYAVKLFLPLCFVTWQG